MQNQRERGKKGGKFRWGPEISGSHLNAEHCALPVSVIWKIECKLSTSRGI